MTPQTVPTMNNLALQGQRVFILELSTGIACSTYFQLLSEWYRPLKVSSLYLLLLPHYTIHTHSHSRLGGWEDGYAPEWQPYQWVFSLQGQWAPVPGKASFFSTYLCMSFHCDTVSNNNVYDRLLRNGAPTVCVTCRFYVKLIIHCHSL